MPNYHHTIIVFILACSLVPTLGSAETFCIHNDSEFSQALKITAGNKENDVIKIVAGSTLSNYSVNPEIGYTLKIQSGYDNACTIRTIPREENNSVDDSVPLPLAPDHQQLKSTTGPVPPPEAGPKSPLIGGDLLSGQANVTILGVPGYSWRHGCGPTALGMVLGYFDSLEFSDLFEGDATSQTDQVNQEIASQRNQLAPGHYEDYSNPLDKSATDPSPIPDKSELPEGDEHVHDSIADFMKTSWSAEDMYYGWSWFHHMGPAYEQFIYLKNPGYETDTTSYYFNSSLTWEILTNEIDNNRPMVFLVDSDGNGSTDHFVTVIGYNDSTMEYSNFR